MWYQDKHANLAMGVLSDVQLECWHGYGIRRIELDGSGSSGRPGAHLARYPNLRFVGSRKGRLEVSHEVIRHINGNKADLRFVAMGFSKQEQRTTRHRQAIKANFCRGAGASFDVVSGNAKRGLAIFRATGTEFLFGLAMERSKSSSQIESWQSGAEVSVLVHNRGSCARMGAFCECGCFAGSRLACKTLYSRVLR